MDMDSTGMPNDWMKSTSWWDSRSLSAESTRTGTQLLEETNIQQSVHGRHEPDHLELEPVRDEQRLLARVHQVGVRKLLALNGQD